MLQIATGKFYRDVELYRTPHRGVFYTNYKAPRGGRFFHTKVGKLEHIEQMDNSNIFTFEVVEKREAFDSYGSPEAIVSTLGYDIVSDYMRLVAFGLNATVVQSKPRLDELLSEVGMTNQRELMPRIFECEIKGVCRDRVEFEYMVNRLVSLNRAEYVSAISAIRRYVAACERVVDDIDAAYSLFVSSIEALAQSHNQYDTFWNDVAENKRKKIDKELTKIDSEIAENIRDILIKEEHHAISRNFRKYAIDMLDSSFYRTDAIGVSGAVSAIDLDAALKNTYQARSKYVHILKKLPETITSGMTGAEVVDVSGKPFLSFSGLARIAREIITNFIYSAPCYQDEIYDYKKDVPGVVQVSQHMLHPRGWVHQTCNFKPERANDRLRGLLYELMRFNQGKDEAITDLTDLMLKIEDVEPAVSDLSKKHALGAMYLIYYDGLPDDKRSNRSEEYIQKFNALLSEPSIYSLVTHVNLKWSLVWSVELSQSIIDEYIRTKHHIGCLHLHRYDEALIYLLVASEYSKLSNVRAMTDAVSSAVKSHPGNEKLVALENHVLSGGQFPEKWWEHLS